MAREMKDSGIEWIGEISNDFKVVRLKFLLKEPLLYGANESGIQFDEKLPRYIRITDIDSNGTLKETGKLSLSMESASGFILKDGDVLFARSGASVGKTFLYYEKYGLSAFAGYLIRARLNELVKAKYFYYYTQSSAYESWKNQFFIQSTIQNIGADRYCQLPVVISNLSSQEQIVSFLDIKCAHIDSVIEKTRTAIEEYKKLKQAVITQAVTKGIRPNREMKDSGIEWIGEVPTDWIVMPSKWLFCNSDLRKQDGDEQMTASQQYGVITQKKYMELTGSKVVFANKGLEDWKHVEPNDFIISLRSFQGGLEMSESTGCITWHYIVLKPRKEIISYYYKWLFKSEMYIKALQRTCNYIRDGQDLRYSNFVQVPLVEPNLIEQKEIADFLNEKTAAIDLLIQKKQQLIKELEDYKKSLIYEYVTGKKEAPAHAR